MTFHALGGGVGTIEPTAFRVAPSVALSHCPNCGNPDCPEVSKTPYWTRCPATDRLARPIISDPKGSP